MLGPVLGGVVVLVPVLGGVYLKLARCNDPPLPLQLFEYVTPPTLSARLLLVFS